MKKAYQIGTAVIAAFFMVAVFQNCGGAQSAKNESPGSSGKASDEISSRYSLIENIAARDLSCNTNADCHAVALGSRACGGPNKYVVVSDANPEIEQIEALAFELEQKEREQNLQSNIAGTCDYRMPPDVSCVSNICQ